MSVRGLRGGQPRTKEYEHGDPRYASLYEDSSQQWVRRDPRRRVWHADTRSSRDHEVLKFLASVWSLKHRTVLTICYAAGLRVSEAVCLKVTDVDSQRMVIGIRTGEGQKIL